MKRPAPWYHGNYVEAHRMFCQIGVGGKESSRAFIDPPTLFGGDGLERDRTAGTGLHFDKGDHASALGNDINFAKRVAIALREDVITT